MKKIILMSLLILAGLNFLSAQIKSQSSGNWSDAATWTGGMVPKSTDAVIISAGNIVRIDNSTIECGDIAFADTTAQLAFAENSLLSVYGNFTIFSEKHKAINEWGAGAQIKFTGDKKQFLKGWSTTGYSTSFNYMVVDKSADTLFTGGTNMRLGIGQALEITKGVFTLNKEDDIEGRLYNGSASSPEIIIKAGAVFNMVSGKSHIRRASNTTEESAKIGLVTVYGTANLGGGSTNRLNFAGISIEDKGLVNVPTGKSTVKESFNVGTITIKNGGIFKTDIATLFWYKNNTTPTKVVIEQGGEYNSTTTTTPLPTSLENNGIFRFSNSGDQTIPAELVTFNNLYLSGSGVKTISANITVNGTLSFRGSAVLSLNNFALTYGSSAILQYGASGQKTPQVTAEAEWPLVNGPKNVSIYNEGGVTLHANRAIEGILTLSTGVFDNNGSADDKVLTLANNATIRRATGTFANEPVFAGSVNVEYISTQTQVTPDKEIPANQDLLNNLTITGTQGVLLAKDLTINGILTVTGSSVLTGANKVVLASKASIIESPGKMVIGNLFCERNLTQNVTETFGGAGIEIKARNGAPGLTSVKRINNPRENVFGTLRYFEVKAANNNNLGADVTIKYDESEITNQTEAELGVFKSLNNGVAWEEIGGTINIENNYVKAESIDSFGLFALNKVDLSPVEENEQNPVSFKLEQNYPNPFNPSTNIKYTVAGSNINVVLKVYDVLGREVATLVNEEKTSGSYEVKFDASQLASGIYFYRLNAGNFVETKRMNLVK